MNGGLRHCTGGRDQYHPQGKKYIKAKSSEEDLQIAEQRREVKAGRKGKIYPTECRVSDTLVQVV